MDDLPGLVDHYDEVLTAIVDAKLHDRRMAEPARHARPVDLMTLLRNSVQEANAARGGLRGGDVAPPH